MNDAKPIIHHKTLWVIWWHGAIVSPKHSANSTAALRHSINIITIDEGWSKTSAIRHNAETTGAKFYVTIQHKRPSQCYSCQKVLWCQSNRMLVACSPGMTQWPCSSCAGCFKGHWIGTAVTSTSLASDFDLFHHLKKHLRGTRFYDHNEFKQATVNIRQCITVIYCTDLTPSHIRSKYLSV